MKKKNNLKFQEVNLSNQKLQKKKEKKYKKKKSQKHLSLQQRKRLN